MIIKSPQKDNTWPEDRLAEALGAINGWRHERIEGDTIAEALEWRGKLMDRKERRQTEAQQDGRD